MQAGTVNKQIVNIDNFFTKIFYFHAHTIYVLTRDVFRTVHHFLIQVKTEFFQCPVENFHCSVPSHCRFIIIWQYKEFFDESGNMKGN